MVTGHSMSIFDEINARAEAIKAEKRARYILLPHKVWRDNMPDMATLAAMGDSGTRSTFAVSSTDSDGTRATHVIIARPTETLALLHAAGLWQYEDETPPAVPMIVRPVRGKWCDCCETRKPISAFARDKRTSDGYSYFCRACREKVAEARWTRGKALKVVRVLNRLTPAKPVLR